MGNETTNEIEQKDKTFTQAELNATVSERLKREREKYADYDVLKQKAAAYDKYQEESKTELQKITDKADALQKELDDMKTAESVRVLKEKVSKETGVPVDLLHGTTEEELTSGAEAIKAYKSVNPSTYPSIRDGGEVGGTAQRTTAQQFADWFNGQ